MTFKFIGNAVAAAGGGAAVWLYKTKTFSGLSPSESEFIEIWDPSNPSLPEPSSAHVLLYALAGWMRVHNENSPPNCGAAFGYKKYLKGEIPQKVYAWRGNHHNNYPYDYPNSAYCGFNTEASFNGAMMLPNPANNGKGAFYRNDFIAPDAVGHAKGNWTKVFNGGNGHWWDRSTTPGENFATNDGPGSNGSIFGPGYNGGHYPAGTGGPGTDTARGPTATKIADGVLDELGMLKLFVKGKAGADSQHADDGDFVVVLPPDLFLFSQLPFNYDTSLLKLGTGMMIPGDRMANTSYQISFNVILEFKG